MEGRCALPVHSCTGVDTRKGISDNRRRDNLYHTWYDSCPVSQKTRDVRKGYKVHVKEDTSVGCHPAGVWS